jgi:methionyl-tRNA formyltransferase
LHDRLALAGAKAIVHTLSHWEECPREAQALEGVNYAHKIDKAEAHIDWTLPAEVIERRIRAFDPFPGCQTSWGGERHKIWRAQVLNGSTSAALSDATHAPAGSLLGISAEGIDVACGSGGLRILELQRAGGKRLGVQAFLNGTNLRPGMLADL